MEKSQESTLRVNSFWAFFARLGDFFTLTLFWLLTSLPIITIGTSTAALFHVVLKTKSGQSGKLWKMYSSFFMDNWKQSVGIFLLQMFILLDAFIIVSMLVEAGAFAWGDFFSGGKYHVALLVVAGLYGAMMIYTAALLAFFKQSTRQCLAAAFCLTFNNLFSTLYFMIVILVLGYLTINIFPALVFVDIPLAVYLISIRMNKIFNKQIARVEKREELGNNPLTIDRAEGAVGGA